MAGLVTFGFGLAGGLVTSGLGAGSAGPSPTTAGPYDLVTLEFATDALEAANVSLSDAQAAILPTLIAAASKEIMRYCARAFVLADYDEIVMPEGGRQDRGEPASAKLANFPVRALTRVYTGRQTALLVQNVDPVNNQIATAAFELDGDVEFASLAYTGLVLTWLRLGASNSRTLSFSAYPTVRALADAVNAVGDGWRATVQAGGPADAGSFPSADLVGVREPKNAFRPGAGLDLFTTPAGGYDVDRATGILRVFGGGGLGPGWGGGWGAPFGSMWDGLGDWGGGQIGWSQYRVSYRAGFATVPESIQVVAVEVLKGMLDRLKMNAAYESETLAGGEHAWTARDEVMALPAWCLQILTLYRDWRS